MELLLPALILLRGLPGSGKSSLASLLSENGKWPVLSIDEYFTDDAGNYTFKYDENHLAYKKCLERTAGHIASGTSKIFVDNTFTLDWEMEPYIDIAKSSGYFLFVVTVECFHPGKNIHGIQQEQLKKMAEKYKVKLY